MVLIDKEEEFKNKTRIRTREKKAFLFSIIIVILLIKMNKNLNKLPKQALLSVYIEHILLKKNSFFERNGQL